MFSESTYVIKRSFPFAVTLLINDMKRKHSSEKDSKSKKPSLGLIHGPGPVNSSSTLITSTSDLMPSIPAGDSVSGATASSQVSVNVSDQLCPSHL